MKKIALITLVALMSLALMVPVFAEVDFTPIQQGNGAGEHVLHVSYDEVRPDYLPGGGADVEKVLYPTLAAGTTEALFFGWAVTDIEIEGFSFTIDGSEPTKVEKYETGQDVVNAASPIPGFVDVSRFGVKVPVTDGTHVVEIYVELADGTNEVIWIAELTVGEPTETTTPGEGNETPDEGNETPDNKPGNAATADSFSVIFMIAAASMIVTVAMKKRAY